MALHTAVAQLGVTFVDAVNVKNNVKSNKWCTWSDEQCHVSCL